MRVSRLRIVQGAQRQLWCGVSLRLHGSLQVERGSLQVERRSFTAHSGFPQRNSLVTRKLVAIWGGESRKGIVLNLHLLGKGTAFTQDGCLFGVVWGLNRWRFGGGALRHSATHRPHATSDRSLCLNHLTEEKKSTHPVKNWAKVAFMLNVRDSGNRKQQNQLIRRQGLS